MNPYDPRMLEKRIGLKTPEDVRAALTWLIDPVVPARFEYLGKIQWASDCLFWESSRGQLPGVASWRATGLAPLLRHMRGVASRHRDDTTSWELRRLIYKLDPESPPPLNVGEYSQLLTSAQPLGIVWHQERAELHAKHTDNSTICIPLTLVGSRDTTRFLLRWLRRRILQTRPALEDRARRCHLDHLFDLMGEVVEETERGGCAPLEGQ